jgi:hypothetical protein
VGKWRQNTGVIFLTLSNRDLPCFRSNKSKNAILNLLRYFLIEDETRKRKKKSGGRIAHVGQTFFDLMDFMSDKLSL